MAENKYSMNVRSTLNGGKLYLAREPGFRFQHQAAEPDLYVSGAVQAFPIGTMYELGDQKFRYVRATSDIDKSEGVGSRGSTSITGFVAAPIGATQLHYTGSSPSNRERFHGGYFTAAAGTNTDAVLRVLEVISGSKYVQLEEPLPVALSSGTRHVIPNPYQVTGSSIHAPVGVALADIDTGEYGWVTTTGIARVLSGSALTAGDGCYMDSSGAIHNVAATTTLGHVGHVLVACTSGQYTAVRLQME